MAASMEREGPKNVELIADEGGLEDKWLFAGIVDGRNVWINELEHSLDLLGGLRDRCAELVVTTSCSLLHTPVDLDAEPPSDVLDDELRSWMAFARQKVGEVVTLARGLGEGREAIAAELDANDRALEDRRISQRTRNPGGARAGGGADRRGRPPPEPVRGPPRGSARPPPACRSSRPRRSAPTPRPRRSARRAPRFARARSTRPTYQRRMRSEVERVIGFQEEVGLDVLVHGEPERNDMVQYFAEQMEGYVFTQNAWVQSYGSRYVRPPILFGDVSRPAPMTTDWIAFAQSLTEKPVKGMLTGPVTMLQWSFVRDDQPRSETCEQLALAIRDEVADLEAQETKVIQVDEPAIREGLPLRRDRWDEYLDGRSTASGSRPRGSGTRPRSTPTCATRTSATSWSRSSRWTPTCC